MMGIILLYAMFFLKIILSSADLVKDFSPPYEIRVFYNCFILEFELFLQSHHI